MRLRRRTAVITAATVVGLTAAGGVAVAATDSDEDPAIQSGTVAVDESALSEDDAAEEAALAELASVDEAAAGEAAVASVGGGEILSAELDDEDGFVVWDVDVRATDGTLHEVTVDAGNSSVLGTELDDDDDRDEPDDDTDDDGDDD
jgi:uncharacterized membrane protein YkoI